MLKALNQVNYSEQRNKETIFIHRSMGLETWHLHKIEEIYWNVFKKFAEMYLRNATVLVGDSGLEGCNQAIFWIGFRHTGWSYNLSSKLGHLRVKEGAINNT